MWSLKGQGLLNRVRHHHCRQLVPRHGLLSEPNDLIGALRIERRGVFVKQEKVGMPPCGHQQRQRLPPESAPIGLWALSGRCIVFDRR